MLKHREGGWAVTLKSATQRGFHPDQLRFNPFANLLLRETQFGQTIMSAYLWMKR